MPAYPSPPGERMAYDRDGSIGFALVNGTLTALSSTEVTHMNDESDSTTTSSYGCADNSATTYIGVVFPELRDVVGYFIAAIKDGNSSWANIETSANTTNGLDGTWTSHGSVTVVTVTQPNYRSMINSVTFSGVNGIRFGNSGNVTGRTCVDAESFHIYGKPSSGQNPDSLRAWHPTLDQEADGTTLDFGDMSRGTSVTKQFRIKNISSTKTAHGITVGMEALSDASPTLIGQFQLSTDNITYSTSISLSDLGPGVISPPIYCRDTVATGAALSVWALRMVATASSMS